MAIKLTLQPTERILFCGSKWWGDPDMPENMQYPTIEVTEGGETYDYPLTFVCQINCEDIAQLDPDGKLPHEGMLYFFAALDNWLGYESPTENGIGEWSKGHFVVKYTKTVNFETFQSCMMVDDDGEALTEHELEIVFSECNDDERCIRLLGKASNSEVAGKYEGLENLLEIVRSENLNVEFDGQLNLMIKPSDLHYGNWKKAVAHLSE